MYYSHEFSHFQKSFSFSVYIRIAHCTSRKNQTKMSAYLRLTCRTFDVRTHHKTLSCLLLFCIFEGSKNNDLKRELR